MWIVKDDAPDSSVTARVIVVLVRSGIILSFIYCVALNDTSPSIRNYYSSTVNSFKDRNTKFPLQLLQIIRLFSLPLTNNLPLDFITTFSCRFVEVCCQIIVMRMVWFKIVDTFISACNKRVDFCCYVTANNWTGLSHEWRTSQKNKATRRI